MEKRRPIWETGGNSLISNSHACRESKMGRWKCEESVSYRYIFPSHKNKHPVSIILSVYFVSTCRLLGGEREREKKALITIDRVTTGSLFQFYPSGPLCQNVCPFTVWMLLGGTTLDWWWLWNFGHLYAQRHLCKKETTWIINRLTLNLTG
jgi:hypothetical protein